MFKIVSKLWIFRLASFGGSILIALIILEGIFFALNYSGRIEMIEREQLARYLEIPSLVTNINQLIYVPHPYFGYVYFPSDILTFARFTFKSNSSGFMDVDFPGQREPGLCVYGLMGGSGAMSWGIENREERISTRLEKLLNSKSTNKSCKKYRVLNLGIGSHHQYQAAMIFYFYKHILDGVIFYTGHNECYQGAMLNGEEPVNFPIVNLHSTLEIASPIKLEIARLRNRLVGLSRYFLDHPVMLRSNIVAYIISRFVQWSELEMDNLHFKLENEGKKKIQGLPHFVGKRVQPEFPNFDSQKYLYADLRPGLSNLVQEQMRKILSVVFQEPLNDVFNIASQESTKFMWVLQPMLGALDKDLTPMELYYISRHPQLQKQCYQALNGQFEKLNSGIKIHDTNNIHLFDSISGEAFLDYVHLNSDGAKVVAEYIFDQIKSEWGPED